MLYVQQKNAIMKTRERDNCEAEFVISGLLLSTIWNASEFKYFLDCAITKLKIWTSNGQNDYSLFLL